MNIASAFYDLAYRVGRPRWDTGVPRPELTELARSRPSGRLVDIGCGTGTNCRFFAEQGWTVVGLDFSQSAIDAARRKADGTGGRLRFVRADATRLSDAGLNDNFDLVIDVGCFHGLSRQSQGHYARGVASLTLPGAELIILGVEKAPLTWRLIGGAGAPLSAVEAAFGDLFEIRSVRRHEGRLPATEFTLTRCEVQGV